MPSPPARRAHKGPARPGAPEARMSKNEYDAQPAGEEETTMIRIKAAYLRALLVIGGLLTMALASGAGASWPWG